MFYKKIVYYDDNNMKFIKNWNLYLIILNRQSTKNNSLEAQHGYMNSKNATMFH